MSAATWAFSRSLARRRVSTSRARSAPARSWPRKVGEPSSRWPSVAGLAMSCSSAPRRSPKLAVDLLGERLGEQRRDGRRVARPDAEHRRRIGLQCDGLLEHLKRVRVDVGVVVAVLLDAAQRVQLGQDRLGQPDLLHEAQGAEHAVAHDDPLQLGEHALLRHRGGLRGARAGQLARRRLGREPVLGGQAHEAHDAQRVVGERARPDGAQAARGEVAGATERVDPPAAAQRLGDRVDREVAQREIGLQRAAAQRAQVGLPAAVGGEHAPGAERVGELEQRAARGPREGAWRRSARRPRRRGRDRSSGARGCRRARHRRRARRCGPAAPRGRASAPRSSRQTTPSPPGGGGRHAGTPSW